MQSVTEIVDEVRMRGGRVTPQRVAVIEAIYDSTNHPTVDEIFDHISDSQPSLSRKTVYQIVYDLEKMGAVSLVDVGTGQLRIDPTVEHEHDHFVCSNCRSVFDINTSKKTLPQKDVLALGEIESVDVVYRDVCRDCSSSK